MFKPFRSDVCPKNGRKELLLLPLHRNVKIYRDAGAWRHTIMTASNAVYTVNVNIHF